MWTGTRFPCDFSAITPPTLFKEMYHCRCLDPKSNLEGCGYCKSVATQLVENEEGEQCWTHCASQGDTCKKKACPGCTTLQEKKRRLAKARYAQIKAARAKERDLQRDEERRCLTEDLEAAKAVEVRRAKEIDEERRRWSLFVSYRSRLEETQKQLAAATIIALESKREACRRSMVHEASLEQALAQVEDHRKAAETADENVTHLQRQQQQQREGKKARIQRPGKSSGSSLRSSKVNAFVQEHKRKVAKAIQEAGPLRKQYLGNFEEIAQGYQGPCSKNEGGSCVNCYKRFNLAFRIGCDRNVVCVGYPPKKLAAKDAGAWICIGCGGQPAQNGTKASRDHVYGTSENVSDLS